MLEGIQQFNDVFATVLMQESVNIMSQVCFLKIDGIEGDSLDKQHKGEIEVLSWSWGESQSTPSPGGGAGAGKVNLQDAQFTMLTSKASPKLFLAGASGQRFKAATLTCRRSDQSTPVFLKITLSDVLVSSFSTNGASSEQLPIDQLSLNYSKIVYEFIPQKPDGSPDTAVKAGWDVKGNKAIN
jgi:type VI secretion system secreted protein Hcp